MLERSKQIEFLQDQLSMPAAMALNYCCTAVCVRDYIKQGLNISCLDYRCSFLFSAVCILLITRNNRTDNPSSLQLVLATDLKRNPSESLWLALRRRGQVSPLTVVLTQTTSNRWRHTRSERSENIFRDPYKIVDHFKDQISCLQNINS